MNKTININLGGFFFHIDESAYVVLKKYLEAISRSLSDDPQGKNEIIADIEARISELLSEKIKDPRQVINEEDINNIIEIMGQPEDYDDTGANYDEPGRFKRTTKAKKLYRDSDNKFLGGVASGLGYYLGIDAIWVRLLFLITTFTITLGFPIYVVLWILLPEAKSTAEKLEMEGEAVNIDNIEKKIKTEINNVGDKIKNTDFSKARNGLQRFISGLGSLSLSLLKIFGKFIGVIIMFISSTTIIALLITAFSFGSIEIIGVGDHLTMFPPFIYSSTIPHWLLVILLLSAVGIPFFLLFLLGLRIVSSNMKRLNRTASLSLLGVWIVAVLALIFTGIEQSTATAYEASKVHEEKFNILKKDTIEVSMKNDDELIFKSFLRKNDEQEYVYDSDGKKIYNNNVSIDLIYNDDQNLNVNVRRISSGKNRDIARENAEEIEYLYQVNGTNLELDGYFLSPEDHLSKKEKVIITLEVPKNRLIYFKNSTQSFLNNIETIHEMYGNDMPNHTYIMTDFGLECLDCDERLFIE